jgi:3-oxoacyl-[acyl-carrier protein] reductase
MTLNGRKAAVTGAAGAIGSAIAAALVRNGAEVALIDVDRLTVEALAARLGDASVPVITDLADPAAIASSAAMLLDRFGKFDILVNNAGILSNNKMEQTDLDEWRKVHTVNVEAPFLLTRAFLPGMRAQHWGRFINISSYAAKCGGLTAGTAYSVSKSALIGLTFSVARETAAQGITANAIAPAYVLSPMVSEQLTDEQRRQQVAQIPVGRFCQPEEVAHAVLFLASPLAGFITGEVIDMNGGLQFD